MQGQWRIQRHVLGDIVKTTCVCMRAGAGITHTRMSRKTLLKKLAVISRRRDSACRLLGSSPDVGHYLHGGC